MNIVYAHHEGSQAERPAGVDTTSSKTIVYLRKNIEQVTHEDPQTGGPVTLWEYDEAELTREEYRAYTVDNRLDDQQAQIDYTAMMTDTLL